MTIQLAQSAELGFLQTILDGGLPLALLVAIYIVFKLYQKEKDAKNTEVSARVAAVEAHATATNQLRIDYSDKVESLLRERIDIETATQRVVIEAKEVMQSVVMQLNAISDLLAAVERGD